MPLSAESLRDTNGRLVFWLDSLCADPGQPVTATPEHMAGLLSELLRVGADLRSEPIFAKGVDLELDAELQKYRQLVERLRDLLPAIHSQLLSEQSRLELQRAGVRSAAQWFRAARQTL